MIPLEQRPPLQFQSLKGIIGDFNTIERSCTRGMDFVSIPERDYRWFQHSSWEATPGQINEFQSLKGIIGDFNKELDFPSR